jgi:glucokinase
VYAPNLFWKDVEVVKMLGMYYNIPVYIGQDSRAAAWAEFQAGAGMGFNHVACLTLGTGIGCGLILDQKIHHGGFLSAGEFGHQIVEENGRICNCGRHGCLEAYAGGLAIVKDALRIQGIALLVNKPVGELTVLDVYNLADQGNTEAMQIVESFVKYLGIGMVNLINLVSPEIICISGGISNAPDRLLFNPLTEFIQKRAYPPVSTKVKVVKSTLGDDAPMIGASMLHLSH